MRVMPIIIHEFERSDRFAVGIRNRYGAVTRKAPTDPGEFGEPLYDRFVRHPDQRRDRDGGERIADVVQPREIQNHRQRRMIRPQNRKFHLRTSRRHVDRPHFGIFIETVLNHAARHLGNDGLHVVIVPAEHRHPIKGESQQKLHESVLETFKIVPVGIHVILINIGHGRQHRHQIQK